MHQKHYHRNWVLAGRARYIHSKLQPLKIIFKAKKGNFKSILGQFLFRLWSVDTPRFGDSDAGITTI